jgi:hypothetical protein
LRESGKVIERGRAKVRESERYRRKGGQLGRGLAGCWRG